MKIPIILRLGVVALTIATAALGCTREDTLRVVVPSNFQGHVTVPCVGTMAGNRTISVAPSGRAPDATCPKDDLHVVVVRDGVIIPPEKPINWSKTGDGIPVGFDFEVK